MRMYLFTSSRGHVFILTAARFIIGVRIILTSVFIKLRFFFCLECGLLFCLSPFLFCLNAVLFIEAMFCLVWHWGSLDLGGSLGSGACLALRFSLAENFVGRAKWSGLKGVRCFFLHQWFPLKGSSSVKKTFSLKPRTRSKILPALTVLRLRARLCLFFFFLFLLFFFFLPESR